MKNKCRKNCSVCKVIKKSKYMYTQRNRIAEKLEDYIFLSLLIGACIAGFIGLVMIGLRGY